MGIDAVVRKLPRVKQCCFCINNLSCASSFIAVWSMFVTVHATRFLLVPACEDQYETSSDGLDVTLLILKPFLIFANLLAFICSFVFLVTMYIMAWLCIIVVYVLSGLVVAILSLAFALTLFLHLYNAKCGFNVNDVVFLVLYAILWVYFMFIVSTYGVEIADTNGNSGRFRPKMYKENLEVAVKYVFPPRPGSLAAVNISERYRKK